MQPLSTLGPNSSVGMQSRPPGARARGRASRSPALCAMIWTDSSSEEGGLEALAEFSYPYVDPIRDLGRRIGMGLCQDIHERWERRAATLVAGAERVGARETMAHVLREARPA